MKATRIQALILLSIALGVPGCNKYGQSPPVQAQKITFSTVQSKAVTVTRRYACQIHSRRRIDVRVPAEGQLAAIPVREGQKVKRDDLLFQIGPPKDKEKPDPENQDQVVSIKAPFDRIIDRLKTTYGTLVEEGDILMTLSDNSTMWVYFNVPEAQYLEYMVEAGQNQQSPGIELILADGSKYPQTGKLGAMDIGIHVETSDIPLHADFPNPDGLLRHGQVGTVLIHRVLKDAVVIPQRATHEILDKRYVFRLDKEGVAHRREIVIRNELDDQFVVMTGIDVGDKIVLDGMSQIHDGDKVE
jgi:membrane fusion protein, multidrug efflux system